MGAFDPDAYLADKRAPAAPAAAPAAPEFIRGPVQSADLPHYAGAEREVGTGEALGLGAVHGAFSGFLDELVGAGRALTESNSLSEIPGIYRRERDKERARLHEAEAQHPIATTLGQFGGGAVTAPLFGAGALGELTGVAGAAARGAAAGIVTGAGNSEADSAAGVVKDAAKSGLVGAGLGAALEPLAARATRGAAARNDQRLLSDIGDRATPTARKKIADAADIVKDTARKFGLDEVAAQPTQLAQATETARREIGARIGDAYKAIGDETLGARTRDVAKAVAAVKRKLAGPSEEPLRRQVDAYLAAVKDRWGDGVRDRITLRALNEEIGNLEKVGFASTDLSPRAGIQLKRDLAGALEDVLQGRLDEIAELGKRVGASSLAKREAFAGLPRAAQAAQELAELNRDYRGLKLIGRAAAERARYEPFSPTGIRQIAGENVGKLLLFSGHPVGAAAAAGAKVAVPAAARAADVALARLVSAAQSGSVPAQLVQQALEAGVPRGLVERFAAGAATSESAPGAGGF